jgi:hypothetical protein
LTIPWRRLGASAAALAVVAALAYSGWKDLPHTWRLLKTQHSTYAGYTAAQKERLFATSIPMSMDAFDFWRFYLQSRDRYYLQMPPEPFSSFANKRQIAQAIAHIYLLPATETQRLDDATVVLSLDANPTTLHRGFSDQHESGLQEIYFSRLRGS